MLFVILMMSLACALLVLAGRLKPGPLFGKADPEGWYLLERDCFR